MKYEDVDAIPRVIYISYIIIIIYYKFTKELRKIHSNTGFYLVGIFSILSKQLPTQSQQ